MDASHADEMKVPDVEVRRHEGYWRGFVRMMIISAVGIGILMAFMAIFLT